MLGRNAIPLGLVVYLRSYGYILEDRPSTVTVVNWFCMVS